MSNSKSTAYQNKIEKKSQSIITLCSILIAVYCIVFIFVDNNRNIYHLIFLGVASLINVIVIIRNLNIKNANNVKILYLLFNNFIFLPYVFMNGSGFDGFLPYYAIISCSLPFFLLKEKKGTIVSFITVFVFSITSILYLVMKIEVIDKFSIYKSISFIIAMIFMVVFSKMFTSLYLSSLKKLRYIAINDDLTKVNTRRYMIEEIIIPRGKIITEIGGVFSFAILDIDNFKNINDTYGHKYGDYTLQAIADSLKCITRDIDKIARFGGDEFMVFLDNIGVKEAREIAERIRKTISEIEIKGGIKTTVSIGVVTIVRGHEKGYLRMADLCLLQAKEEGRNRVISYEIDFDTTKRSKYEDKLN